MPVPLRPVSDVVARVAAAIAWCVRKAAVHLRPLFKLRWRRLSVRCRSCGDGALAPVAKDAEPGVCTWQIDVATVSALCCTLCCTWCLTFLCSVAHEKMKENNSSLTDFE